VGVPDASPRTDPTTVALDALASYRVTRLLVSDGIIDRPRDALMERLRRRERDKLVELIECPWCTGFWVALGVVVARRLAPRVWDPIARVFAYSAAAGFVATRVRSLDDTHDVTSRLVEDNGAGTTGSDLMHQPARMQS
jgi:hypothetical protein